MANPQVENPTATLLRQMIKQAIARPGVRIIRMGEGVKAPAGRWGKKNGRDVHFSGKRDANNLTSWGEVSQAIADSYNIGLESEETATDGLRLYAWDADILTPDKASVLNIPRDHAVQLGQRLFAPGLTWKVETAGGGVQWHCLIDPERVPQGELFFNRDGTLKNNIAITGGPDLLTGRHLRMLPCSWQRADVCKDKTRTEEQRKYTFASDSGATFAPAPDALYEQLTRWAAESKPAAPAKPKRKLRAVPGADGRPAAPDAIPIGNRHNTLTSLAMQLVIIEPLATRRSMLAVLHEVNEIYCEEPMPESEIKRCLDTALAKAERPLGMGMRCKHLHPVADNARDTWRNQLRAMCVELCYNRRAEQVESRPLTGGDWQPLSGFSTAALQVDMDADTAPAPVLKQADAPKPNLQVAESQADAPAAKLPPRVRFVSWAEHNGRPPRAWSERAFMLQLKAYLDKRERDPLLEKGRELETRMKSEKNLGRGDLIYTLLTRKDDGLFRVEPAYEKAARLLLPMIIGGVVRRVYADGRKGAKWDFMPIIIGPPGIGKSTLLRCLVYDPDQFSDFAQFGLKAREMGEQFMGKTIIEVSELVAFRTADVRAITAEVSRQAIMYRRVYEKTPELRAYLHVLVGTSNDPMAIPMEGRVQRRFMPVQMEAAHGPAVNQQRTLQMLQPGGKPGPILDELYAEAIRMNESGELEKLIPEFHAEINKLTPAHRIRNLTTEEVLDKFEQAHPGQFDSEGVGLIELIQYAEGPPDGLGSGGGLGLKKVNEQKLCDTMKARGFESYQGTTREDRLRRWYTLRRIAEMKSEGGEQ